MPLVGRAETTTSTTVFNSGYTFPDFYLCFERDIAVRDFEENTHEVWRFVIAYVHISTGVTSSWVGGRQFDVHVFNEEDLRQHYTDEFGSEDFSFTLMDGYAITRVSSLILCQPYRLALGFGSVPLDVPVHLSGGFVGNSYYFEKSTIFSMAPSVVLALRALTPQIVLGDSAVSSSDYADVTSLLTPPDNPSVDQRDFINGNSVITCADFLRECLPSALWVPLISLCAFSLIGLVFVVVKHI